MAGLVVVGWVRYNDRFVKLDTRSEPQKSR